MIYYASSRTLNSIVIHSVSSSSRAMYYRVISAEEIMGRVREIAVSVQRTCGVYTVKASARTV